MRMCSVCTLRRPCSSQRSVSRSTKSHLILYKSTPPYAKQTDGNCSSAFFTKSQLLFFWFLICQRNIKKFLIRGDYVGIGYLFTRDFGSVSTIFIKWRSFECCDIVISRTASHHYLWLTSKYTQLHDCKWNRFGRSSVIFKKIIVINHFYDTFLF